MVRDGQPIAAIVPIADLERIDPPDPGAGGVDPLLALCGNCKHDGFVDALAGDLSQTHIWLPK